MDRRQYNRRLEDRIKQKPDSSPIAICATSALTVISIAIGLSLALSGNLTDIQKEVFDQCMVLWKYGFGAIIGVMGKNAFFPLNPAHRQRAE